MALTEQKKKFADKYFETLKGSFSAEYAGYSEKTSKQIAYNLLQEPEVEEYLSNLRAKVAERNEITQDRIVQEFAKIGFSNIQDYIDGNLDIKDLSTIDQEKAAAISTINKTVTEFDGGVKTVIEFKLYDKPGALTALGRHVGIFEKDNDQSRPDTEIEVKIIRPKEVDE